MSIPKIFFPVALLGVIVNTLACILSIGALWIAGFAIFIIGAVGVLLTTGKPKERGQ